MLQKSGWYYIKIFLLLFGLAILLWIGGRAFNYYSENSRYAHYIIKSLVRFRSPIVEDGYTERTSYAPGEFQKVYVDARQQGNHWLRLYSVTGQVVDRVQAAIFDQDAREDGAVKGFGYQASFTFQIPDSLPSG